jgi:hypothetical protein
VTVIDSLDTMYLMGLHDEFNRAVRFVEHSNFTQPAVRPRLLPTNIINSLHLHTQSQGVYAHSSRQSSVISEASSQPMHSPATPSSYNAQTTSDGCSPPHSAPTVGSQILASQLLRKCIFHMSVSSSANGLRSGERRGPQIGILAEIASCQLEYTYLAKETGKKRYFDLVRIPCQCLHLM